MAFREGGGGGGGVGPMAGVIMVMIGLVVVVAVMQFAPTIGGSIEASQPALDPTSDWNSTHNTELPSSSTFYTSNVSLVSLLVTIIIWLCVFRSKREYQPEENLAHPCISDPYLTRIFARKGGVSCVAAW